jgi:hypothetical protein
MSYSLDLYFEPPVRRYRLLQHFAARRHFSVKNDDVVYENPYTGVYFFVACAAQGNYLGATSSLPNSRSITIGPAISALKLRMCCPTSLRCFSQGSKILRCKVWEKDLIRARVLLAAGISATCLPPATPYLPAAMSYRCLPMSCALPGSGIIIVPSASGAIPGYLYRPSFSFASKAAPAASSSGEKECRFCCLRSTMSWSAELFPAKSATASHLGPSL